MCGRVARGLAGAGAERLLAAEGMAPRAVKRLVDACDLRKGRSTLDLLGQRGDELVQVVWMVSAVRCVVQPVHLNRHAERHLPFAVAPVADLPSALALVVAVAFKPLSRGFPTPRLSARLLCGVCSVMMRGPPPRAPHPRARNNKTQKQINGRRTRRRRAAAPAPTRGTRGAPRVDAHAGAARRHRLRRAVGGG